MSGPDLYVFALKFLALKKLFISLLWPKKFLFLIFKKDIMQLFSVEAIEFSKKDLNSFFDPEKVKKRASKVAHNRPRPFYFTV